MALFPQPLKYTEIGKVGRMQGLDGDMHIVLQYIGVAAAPSVIFLYHHGSYLPFHVRAWRVDSGRGIFHLEGVESRTEAAHFCGSGVFVDAVSLAPYLKGSIYAFVGYGVEDVEKGFLGTVVEVEGRILQPLLCLSTNEGERQRLPFDASFVNTIDEKKKRIVMALPTALVP